MSGSEAGPSLSSTSPLEQKSGHSSLRVISFLRRRHKGTKRRRKRPERASERRSAFKSHKSQDQLKPTATPPSSHLPTRLSIRKQPSRNPTRLPARPPSSSQPLTEKGAQDEWATLLQRAMCSQTAAPAPFCSLHSLY